MRTLFVFTALFFCFAATCFADNFDAAMDEIKAEKSVIAASWGPHKGPSLFVAVKDDGSRRDGFAEYLCMTLRDHGIHGAIIHVMAPADYAKYRTENDLGRHICE